MTDIVLVPGGFHGGWYFSAILPAIRAAGHRVHAITLSGLGERRHLNGQPVNLDTHIDDVVQLIEHEQLDDIVLLGHSYAGMVIAGVADRLAGRVRTLIHLDALVPADGDSIFSLMPDAAINVFFATTPDGIGVPPPPGLDPRTAPHPIASFLQPIRLSGAEQAVPRKIFVWCRRDSHGPFGPIHDRLQTDRSWEVHAVPFGHDIMNEAPETVKDLVLAAAQGGPFMAAGA
jgi:pimeloyl-ACP methyl ester carboxylesterase